MRTVLVGILLSMLAAAGCATTNAESQPLAGYNFADIDTIAIIEVTGIYSEAAKNKISDLFTMKLMEKGYTFIERQRMKTLLKEQQFQSSDVTTDQGAARAGKILNVPAVMVIRIPKYSGGKMEMSATLIDVETGKILWLGEGSGNTNKGLATFMGAAAGAALGAVVAGGDTSDRVIGGVIGGVAGGAAGHILSPEQEALVKKVVAKVVASLPSRVPQPTKSR